VAVLYVRVPDDRLGVIIGSGGATKRRIEQRSGTTLTIDREDGSIEVVGPDAGDPIGVIKARDVALAIGRGFSPARAERLFRDDTYLGVIDIKNVTGRHQKASLWRIRSRLIGTDGKARSRIEELSGCSMSVYGSTVALIGQERQLERATRAVELLLRGSEHAAVFHLLARQRREDARDDATTTVEVPGEE